MDLPGGRLNPGELPLEGARRELEEETGFFPKNISKLGYYSQFPGMIRAGTHLFIADNLVTTNQMLDNGEELEIVFLPVNEAIKMIMDGRTIDGSLQLAVLLALHKGFLE